MRKWTDKALFLIQNLDLEKATQFDGAKWEYFQIALLNDESTFTIETKSRQIAWSWTIAAEAIANAIVNNESTVFVSINLAEASEKIVYAQRILESLPKSLQMPLKVQNKLELRFKNGARLISLPSKPPRGKAQMHVRLDEFAHVQNDTTIYQGALPIISKGGTLRIGSSPLGASGLFWQIFEEPAKKYPGYKRLFTPWWKTYAFTTDLKKAVHFCPTLDIEQRVRQFGNERIQAIYDNIPLEDFQQEYEAIFVDESTAWITWKEIKANQSPDHQWFICKVKGNDISAVKQLIINIGPMLRSGEIKNKFLAGMDIGRKRHKSEIILVEKDEDAENYNLRVRISLDNTSFEKQEEAAQLLIDSLKINTFTVDQSGIGYQIAEQLRNKNGGIVHPESFTNTKKEKWATDLKLMLQKENLGLPQDREIAQQLHSVKRKVTANKNYVFDVDASERHHADIFWSMALAISREQSRKIRFLTW